MYCLVCPFTKTFDEIGITYSVPDVLTSKLKVGQIIDITIRNKSEIGIIIGLTNQLNIKFNKDKIKDIVGINNNFIYLSDYRVELLKWIAKYYFTVIHNSFNLFLPKNLKEKIKKNTVKIPEIRNIVYNYNYNNKLSKLQNNAFKIISNSKKLKFLLYGLTGSGKTEIYINLIKETLDKGKQSLFLIPEIILTNQLSDKIINIFGNNVLILNSTITEANKTKNWLSINNGDSKIIIGTRSALFYPYNNLGLIIVDEEHDNSYISDSAPRYKTIEVANKITELNGNKLILGSGTPSINSMYKSIKGDYKLVNLMEVYKK